MGVSPLTWRAERNHVCTSPSHTASPLRSRRQVSEAPCLTSDTPRRASTQGNSGQRRQLWGDGLVCKVLAFGRRPWCGLIGHRPSTEVTPVPATEQTATTLQHLSPDLRSRRARAQSLHVTHQAEDSEETGRRGEVETTVWPMG